jgi:hypothetical protein
MRAIDVSLVPSLFGAAGSSEPGEADVRITLIVEPSRVRVPGRARVVVRVQREGRPVDGYPISISCTRGVLSRQRGTTRFGMLVADLEGLPEDVGPAAVRVYSELREAQAVLSAGLEFIR